MSEAYRLDTLARGVAHWLSVAAKDGAEGYIEAALFARSVASGLAAEAAALILSELLS